MTFTPKQNIQSCDEEIKNLLESHPDHAHLLKHYRRLFIPSDNDRFIEFTGFSRTGSKFTVTHQKALPDYLLACHLGLFEHGEDKTSKEKLNTLTGRAYTCQLPSWTVDSKPHQPRGYYYAPRQDEVFKIGVQLGNKQGITKTVMLDLDVQRYYSLVGVEIPRGDNHQAIRDAKEKSRAQVAPYLLADAQKIIGVLEPHGLCSYLEWSTSGGLHLWLFLAEPVPVAKVQAFFKQQLKPLDIPEVEVYPKASTEHSNNCYLPVEIINPDGNVIPLNDADYDFTEDIEVSPTEVINKARTAAKPKPKFIHKPPANLDKATFSEALRACILNPPQAFQRHEAVPDFINLAERHGCQENILELLCGQEVYEAWGIASDGTRTLEQWEQEVLAWSEQDPPVDEQGNALRRGIPFLKSLGFDLPDLRPNMQSALGRPDIQVNDRFMRDISDEAVKVMVKANNPPKFFYRAGLLSRFNTEIRQVEPFTRTSLKGMLDRSANFVRVKKEKGADGEIVEIKNPSRCPNDVTADILELSNLPFPKLESISFIPLFLPGGELLFTNGYHVDSGIMLALDDLELRTDMPVDEAVGLLIDDTFADFPYADPEAGRAHTLALVLQAFVRPMITSPTPLFVVDAPARGTGKGLLCEAASLIVLGKAAPVMVLPRDNDEYEKRITAALLSGQGFMFMDNVTSLKSEVLAAALTSETWRGRLLGKSEMLELPNQAIWLATGNNIELSDEIIRRTIPIRLDAGVERPEERTGFKHTNLPQFVKAKRSALISACLSIVQTWVDEDMPHGDKTLGRFESWAQVMGGILGVAGVSGLLSGRERLHDQADSESREWGYLCKAWYERYGGHTVTAQDLFEVCKDGKHLLELWGGRNHQGAMQRIGRTLTGKRDRVYGGYAIRYAGKDGRTRNNTYRLERVGKKTPETPDTPADLPRYPTGTQTQSRVFLGDEKAKHPQEPQNTRKTPDDTNTLQDVVPDAHSSVSGVSGVYSEPDKTNQPVTRERL